MKVVELLVKGKANNDAICEDAVFTSKDYIVIIDGSTSKTAKKWQGKTAGRVARDCILNTLPKLPGTLDHHNFFNNINRSILEWYDSQNITVEMENYIEQRCTASVSVYSRHHNQIWFVGSGQGIIDNIFISNTLKIDELFTQVRCYYLRTELKRGLSEHDLFEFDTSWDFIVPLLRRQIMFQNQLIPSEYNYFAVDGFFTMTDQVKIFEVPDETKTLVLASDGYPYIYSNLKDTEKALEKILTEDPLCYKTFKSMRGIKKGQISFDDRSYVRVILNEY